jgi:hypothetical protein
MDVVRPIYLTDFYCPNIGGHYRRLYKKFFDTSTTTVEYISGGVGRLEQCVQELSGKFRLVIGIRDADFVRLSGISYNNHNMFLTDCHDMEMIILNHEKTLSAILHEYLDESREQHLEFRNHLMQMILPLSCLKWLNITASLGLPCAESRFIDLLMWKERHLNIREFLRRVLQKTTAPISLSQEELLEKIQEIENYVLDIMQITNGHDLLAAFAEYFRKHEIRKGISQERLEEACRIAFDESAFKSTYLYADLRSWQEINKTRLFRD